MESMILENETIDFQLFIRYKKSNVTGASNFPFEVDLFRNRPKNGQTYFKNLSVWTSQDF